MDDIEQTNSDTEAVILAGLEQARSAIFGTDPIASWAKIPFARMKQLASYVEQITEPLSPYDTLLIGAYMAASARTQIQTDAA